MVQNYRHVNQWTVKNGYPLLLIADILDGIDSKKVFTKLDLRWRYNNVRIKREMNGRWYSQCISEPISQL